jgi:wobble nucleotide-excising tRNase
LSDSVFIPQIKVFNGDFVEENVFTSTGEVTPIFFLGEDSISKQKEIEMLNTEKIDLQDFLMQKIEELSNENKALDNFCIDRATNIRELLRSSGLNYYNNYDKRNFRSKCDQLKSEDYLSLILQDDEMDKLKHKINETSKEKLSELFFSIESPNKIRDEVAGLLEQTVISSTIDRFKEDGELNTWAKTGFAIHKKKNDNTCPFCGQKLPENYLQRLEEHFNDEYEKLLTKIEILRTNINRLADTMLRLPDKARLYDELREQYERCNNDLIAEHQSYRSFLKEFVFKLEEKEKNPFIIVNFEIELPTIDIESKLAAVNAIISDHNNKTDNFQKEKNVARDKLEISLVAEAEDKYLKIQKRIAEINAEKSVLTDNISKIKKKVESFEREILEHRKPADEINKDLIAYLGRDEIKFEVKENGYRITRNGEDATALSEGEKTAIAFTYFLQTLKDKDFDISEGVVVIDDPISSLDSNAIFYAFGFMKERTKNAKQLFVLTHNFTFFRQVKKWFLDVKKYSRHPKKKATFYMLSSSKNSGQIMAILKPLDDLLLNYESEYHYLFSIVYKYSKEQDKELEPYYHMPNIARRLLEAFLAFRQPNAMGLYKKLDELAFDNQKKVRILRFVHTHSHSDHIEDNPDHDMSILRETPDVLKDLLALMESEDKNHYDQMLEIVNSRESS